METMQLNARSIADTEGFNASQRTSHYTIGQFLMALIALGVSGWIGLTVAQTAFDLGPAEVLKLATSIDIPAAVATGVAVSTVIFLGPVVIRRVLAKRIFILLALTALTIFDSGFAAATRARDIDRLWRNTCRP